MGVALWMPNGKCTGVYMKLPEEVLTVWSRQATASARYDVFEIEAVGFASTPQLAAPFHSGSVVGTLHFFDNTAALATLVKGSSFVLSCECLLVRPCTKCQGCDLVVA